MPSVTSTEANRKFSKILANAMNGKSTDITVRGKLVARLVPVSADDAAREAEWHRYLEELRSRPAMNLPRVKREELYDR
jgi:prevent-host-death family protein